MQIFSNYNMQTGWIFEIFDPGSSFIGQDIRIYLYSHEGSMSLYFTQEQAEALAFQIQAFFQDKMTEEQHA